MAEGIWHEAQYPMGLLQRYCITLICRGSWRQPRASDYYMIKEPDTFWQAVFQPQGLGPAVSREDFPTRLMNNGHKNICATLTTHGPFLQGLPATASPPIAPDTPLPSAQDLRTQKETQVSHLVRRSVQLIRVETYAITLPFQNCMKNVCHL